MPFESDESKKYVINGGSIPERVRGLEVGLAMHLEASNKAITHFIESVDKVESFQKEQVLTIEKAVERCVNASGEVSKRVDNLMQVVMPFSRQQPIVDITKKLDTTTLWTSAINNFKWIVILIAIFFGGTALVQTLVSHWIK